MKRKTFYISLSALAIIFIIIGLKFSVYMYFVSVVLLIWINIGTWRAILRNYGSKNPKKMVDVFDERISLLKRDE